MDTFFLPSNETLYLNNKELYEIPHPHPHTKHNLYLLDCSYNNISIIQPHISSYYELKILYLNCNEITEIPDCIQSLKQLYKFEIDQNRLKIISDPISHLTKLKTFSVSKNSIRTITPLLYNCIELTHFDITSNKIVNIPENTRSLNKLRYLYFSNNYFNEIPNEIYQLEDLNTLYLIGNRITNISNNISSLKKLAYLNLTNNDIEYISPELYSIYTLVSLLLSNNNIRIIDKNISNLIDLKYLYIDNNYIESLPAEMIRLTNLKYICYIGNNNIYIPHILIRLFNKNIYNVYDDKQNVHNRYIQESIKDSLFYLLNKHKINNTSEHIINIVLNDDILQPDVKKLIINYIKEDNIHTVLHCTFEDVFTVVWHELSSYDINIQIEIKKRINEEIYESECKCFTGILSRTINCLSGFCPYVCIKLNDSENIGNIISIAYSKYINIDEIKNYVKHELTAQGYPDDIINKWIEHIY